MAGLSLFLVARANQQVRSVARCLFQAAMVMPEDLLTYLLALEQPWPVVLFSCRVGQAKRE
jgi:hypothetical protein